VEPTEPKAPDAAASDLLPDWRESRALARFVEPPLDHFRLALVAMRTPAERGRLVEWLRGRVRPDEVLAVEVSKLPGPNPWAALPDLHRQAARPHVLVLDGADDAVWAGDREHAPHLESLNLARDTLVREVACPWILLLHPAAVLRLLMFAPDFADFFTLRVVGGEERPDSPEGAEATGVLGFPPARSSR